MKISRRVGDRATLLSVGFALPTVVITSVIMLAVLATAVQVVAAGQAAIRGQQYQQQAREAAESGVQAAIECLVKKQYTIPSFWTASAPLTPKRDCLAASSTSYTVSSYSSYVIDDGLVRTSYEVKPPTISNGVFLIKATGTTEVLRKTDKSVWRTYTATSGSNAALPVMASIDGGFVFGLGLSADKTTIFAWGDNADGQLGTGDTVDLRSPTATVTSTQLGGQYIKQVAAGNDHSLALAVDGTVWAWGKGTVGQLGDGASKTRYTPVKVRFPAGVKIASIGAGSAHSLAVDTNGKAYGWGSNSSGQLGDGTQITRTTPVAVTMPGTKKFVSVDSSSNSSSTLGITTDGLLYGWGRNSNGQIGDGTKTDRLVPTPTNRTSGLLATGKVKDAASATGGSYILAVNSTGTATELYATGSNYQGQRGTGGYTGATAEPTLISTYGTGKIPSGEVMTQVVADGFHVAVLTNAGKVYSWGWNHVGQVGIGELGPNQCAQLDGYSETTRMCSWTVKPVLKAGTSIATKNISQIAAGDRWTYAVATDGTAHAWGHNSSGMLGIDSEESIVTKATQMVFYPRILSY